MEVIFPAYRNVPIYIAFVHYYGIIKKPSRAYHAEIELDILWMLLSAYVFLYFDYFHCDIDEIRRLRNFLKVRNYMLDLQEIILVKIILFKEGLNMRIEN